MPQIKHWNGSAWVKPKAIKQWDGTQWVQRIGKVWNGSAWVAFITYFNNAWATLTQGGSSRGAAGGAWSDRYIHVVTGRTSSSAGSTTNALYNTATNTWSTGASSSSPADEARAVSNGSNVVYANLDGGAFRSYNNDTNSWTNLASPGDSTVGIFLDFVSSQKILKINTNTVSGTNIPNSYDAVSNTWTTLATLSGVKTYAFGGSIGGKAYIAGGGSNANGVGIYDPTSNTWSYGTAMPTARFNGASGKINGMIICASGTTVATNAATAQLSVNAYIVASNTWTTLADAPAARYQPAFGTSPDGKQMFMAYGMTTSNTYATTLYSLS